MMWLWKYKQQKTTNIQNEFSKTSFKLQSSVLLTCPLLVKRKKNKLLYALTSSTADAEFLQNFQNIQEIWIHTPAQPETSLDRLYIASEFNRLMCCRFMRPFKTAVSPTFYQRQLDTYHPQHLEFPLVSRFHEDYSCYPWRLRISHSSLLERKIYAPGEWNWSKGCLVTPHLAHKGLLYTSGPPLPLC